MRTRVAGSKRSREAGNSPRKRQKNFEIKKRLECSLTKASQPTTNTRQACETEVERAENPPPQSTLMDLPKEILVEIIGHVLTVDKPIFLREPKEQRWTNEIASLREIPQWSRQTRFPPGYHHPPKRKRMRKSPLLNVIRVCKDFYFAGIEAYYTKNTFHFECVHHLRKTKARLTDRQKSFLNKISVDIAWAKKTPATDPPVYGPMEHTFQEDVLADLPELNEVVVNSLMETTVYMAAASRAEKVKGQIREKVKQGWPSQAENLAFVFPKGWGVLKDK